MKQLLKNILGLYFSTAAFAAPPVTVFQEQNPGGYLSRNYVLNPGAEKNITAGVTNASSILTRSTTTPIEGAAEYSVNATATSQNIDWALNTFQQGLKGQNCEARWTVEGDASLYKAQVVQNSIVIADSGALSNFSTPLPVSLNFPCGDLSTTTFIRLTSTGDGATILVDSIYVGLATNLGQVNPITDWVAFTPTGSWTTNTSYSGFWRRVGGALDVRYTLTLSGAPTATSLTVNLPAGLTIDTGKIGGTTANPAWHSTVKINDNGTDQFDGQAAYTSTTAFALYSKRTQPGANPVYLDFPAINQATPMTFASGDTINVEISGVPIVGWTATTVYRPDQAGIQWTAFTPVSSWVSGATPTGFYRCDGDTAEVQWQVAVTGTPTSATLTLNLPSSFTIDTAKLASGTDTQANIPGSIVTILDSGTDVLGPSVLVYNSTTSVQVRRLVTISGTNPVNVSVGNFVNATNPITFATGDRVYAYGRFPVTADSPCSRVRAPLLVGSVVSKSTGVTGLEYANIAAASGCTLSSNSPGMASVSAPGGSECAVLFASNTFTATPVCTCSTTNGTANRGCYIKNASSSGVSTQVFDSGSTNQNTPVSLVCVGPR